MRSEPNLRIEKYRREHPSRGRTPHGVNYGFFIIPRGKFGPHKGVAIMSSGTGDDDEVMGWEHVSVSVEDGSTPTWEMMCFVKSLFWRDDETVLQFHPREDQYVNFHPACLHLWKRVDVEHELPPVELIGPLSRASV